MIVTLTANPALDVTYRVERIVMGDTQRVDAPREQAGGKGVNVARVLHQVGEKVLAVLPVGGIRGEELVRDLTRAGLPHVAVPVSADSRRTVTVVEDAAADNLVLSEHGRPLSPRDVMDLLAAVEDKLSQARCLVVSGSLPPQVPLTIYRQLVGLAHDRDIPIIVDTSGPGLLAAAEAGADLVKPNRAELREALGQDGPITGARQLLALGAAQVVVSLGSEGMVLVTDSQIVRARLPLSLRGNPSGAGDAAVAALAVGLSTNAALPDLARAAVSWSAAAVLAPVAGVLHPTYRELGARVVLN